MMEPKYRCGWCGECCDKDGNVIEWPEDKTGYDEAEKVHGECCIHEQMEKETRRVTRDMAIDAGDPSLEGQLY